MKKSIIKIVIILVSSIVLLVAGFGVGFIVGHNWDQTLAEEENTERYTSENIDAFIDKYPNLYDSIILNNANFKSCLSADGVDLYADANLRLDCIEVYKDNGNAYASFLPNTGTKVSFFYDVDTTKMWLLDIEMFDPELRDTLITTAMYMVYDSYSTSDDVLTDIAIALSSETETTQEIDNGKYLVSHYIKESSERFCISIL